MNGAARVLIILLAIIGVVSIIVLSSRERGDAVDRAGDAVEEAADDAADAAEDAADSAGNAVERVRRRDEPGDRPD